MKVRKAPPRAMLVTTIEEFQRRCHTERVRFEWPGGCSWCGGQHSKESSPGGHVCVLCHVPHMGYCFEPNHEGDAPGSAAAKKAAQTRAEAQR